MRFPRNGRPRLPAGLDLESLGINQLTVRERLELIEQIWDSLHADGGPHPGFSSSDGSEAGRRSIGLS
jgi:hypothetical protein